MPAPERFSEFFARAQMSSMVDREPSSRFAPVPTTIGAAMAELLEAARMHLLRKEVAEARAAIMTALSIAECETSRADAELLLAECYVTSGEVDAAIAQLRGIADRYHELPGPAGTALFQAARHALKSGHAEDARTLLQAYLTRYPEGVLVGHVRAQLGRLA